MRQIVAAVVTAQFLVLAPQAAQAVGSCQGQPATIEATGGTVTGTDGADVILVTDGADVFALGGDDLICTGGGSVEAGPGDDHVVVGRDQTYVVANLGPGDDTYDGGSGFDYVDVVDAAASGADRISTGAGFDGVGSGVPNEPNGDVVHLGMGGGVVSLQAPAGSHAVITAKAGDGLDPTVLGFAPADAASYVLDARPASRRLTRNGVPVASVTGFPDYSISSPRASVRLLGTDAAEEVTVEGTRRFGADLGAGRDRLYLYEQGFAIGGDVSGGAGHDVIWALASEAVTADLRTGEMSTDSAGPPARWDVARFEELFFLGSSVDVRGRSADEVLVGVGCEVELRGGRGDDLLVLADHVGIFPFPDGPCEPRHGRFRGGPGNDVLKGSDWHDVLIGGAGRDVANGRGGKDRCLAEREKSCER